MLINSDSGAAFTLGHFRPLCIVPYRRAVLHVAPCQPRPSNCKISTLQGSVAASDYYAQEMQAAVEDAAADLEREVRQEIETVRTDILQELCKRTGLWSQASSTPPLKMYHKNSKLKETRMQI